MGHAIFALDTQAFIKVNNVCGNLKNQMKVICLRICVPLSYIHRATETTFVDVTIYANICEFYTSSKAEQKMTFAQYQTC